MGDGEAPETQRRCSGTNQDGAPCSGQARESGYCPWHDPANAAKLPEWRREGGKAKSHAARARKRVAGGARDLADVQGRLMIALEKVESGDLEPGQGQAMAAIARAIVVVAGAADFERRLHDLERAAGERAG